jgi:ribosomal peptide maturation radical SAM protein 1
VAPARKSRRVALVVMPPHLPHLPSLGVATLAEGLRRIGHDVDVLHFNVEAASVMGLRDYCKIGSEESWVHNLGEWLFADPSITPGAADVAQMRRHLAGKGDASSLVDLDLELVRERFRELLERWARAVAWASYDVVGFGIMFQQLNASLRMAQLIKARTPTTRVVFGGSALERPMGDVVARRYPWIDAVFSGYADRSLMDYVDHLPAGTGQIVLDEGPTDLDELPIPSFFEFIQAVRQHRLEGRIDPQIVMETSRGCWYGEKHHCTFCGVNGSQMRFRQKSADRVFEEVRELSRYGRKLWTTDDIMPLDFFQTLFPRMQREGVTFPAFFEVKSNLDRAKLEAVRNVGIDRLQPGIESLSTPILKRMRKGVTAIQNLWFLRACEELGVGCQWNILYGFPGEEAEEYVKMADLVARIAHLQAPLGCAKIHMLRFSPNHTQASELGFADVRPDASYALAFGPHAEIDDQAYLFDYGYADGRDPDSYTRRLTEQALRWMMVKGRPLAPRCELFEIGGRRVVIDTRKRGSVGVASPRFYLISDEDWRLLQALESPVPMSKLARDWPEDSLPLAPIVERFIERDFAFCGDGRLVRLVVVRGQPTLLAEARRVLGEKSRRLWRELRQYA